MFRFRCALEWICVQYLICWNLIFTTGPRGLVLTCGRSRFRLHSTQPLCCKSGEMPVHYQHNRILTGMFDSFSQLPAFAKKGIVISNLKPGTDYILILDAPCSSYICTASHFNTQNEYWCFCMLFHTVLVRFPALCDGRNSWALFMTEK